MCAIDTLEASWDSEANFPPQFGAASEYARKMAKRPLDYFRNRVRNIGLGGNRVLDAGCGTGNWSFGLTSVFDEVHGIDYVRERAELCSFIAKKYGLSQTSFREGNVLETGFPDAFFDAVFCFGVIIVPQTPVQAALAEFRRIVKPGGEIFVCLNAPGWAHYLASSEVESRSELGKKGLYVYLRDNFAGLPNLITENLVARQALESASANGNEAVLTCLAQLFNHRFRISSVTAQIAETCGPAYLERLAGEVIAMASGVSEGFEQIGGYPAVYDPDEVGRVVAELGLEDFVWGQEGRLIRAEHPVELRPIYKGAFNGMTANWEFLVKRP